MSKFSRCWTLQMKTDRQGFKDAFYKVVRANKTFWVYNALLTYEIGEDCGGEVRQKTFIIVKRGNNDKRISLMGDIVDESNGLKLVMRISSSYNYFTVGMYAVLFALSTAIIGLEINIISTPVDTIWFMVFCYYLPICVLAYWGVYKFVQWKINQLQQYYISVLNEIEKQAMAGNRN